MSKDKFTDECGCAKCQPEKPIDPLTEKELDKLAQFTYSYPQPYQPIFSNKPGDYDNILRGNRVQRREFACELETILINRKDRTSKIVLGANQPSLIYNPGSTSTITLQDLNLPIDEKSSNIKVIIQWND